MVLMGHRNKALLAEDIICYGLFCKEQTVDSRLRKTVKFQPLTSSQNADTSTQAEDDEVINVKEVLIMCTGLQSEVIHLKTQMQRLRTRVSEPRGPTLE